MYVCMYISIILSRKQSLNRAKKLKLILVVTMLHTIEPSIREQGDEHCEEPANRRVWSCS